MLFDLLLLFFLISTIWNCKTKQDYYNIIMVIIIYIFLDKVVNKKKHGNKLIEGVPTNYTDRFTEWLGDKWPSISALLLLIYNNMNTCVKEQRGHLQQLQTHGRNLYSSRMAPEYGRSGSYRW